MLLALVMSHPSPPPPPLLNLSFKAPESGAIGVLYRIAMPQDLTAFDAAPADGYIALISQSMFAEYVTKKGNSTCRDPAHIIAHDLLLFSTLFLTFSQQDNDYHLAGLRQVHGRLCLSRRW